MADLAIIVPTRGRPQQFAELVAAVAKTATGSVEIWAGLDYDDPVDYLLDVQRAEGSEMVIPTRGRRRSLSAWTNNLAGRALISPNPPRYLASLGDDHRPRTPGWNAKLVEAIGTLGAPGIAYGNDLLQGARLPTAWVVSAELVKAVGWMMLPTCQHLAVDNAILALGEASERIVYCPDVVIEHLHPIGGKAEWDDSYRDSNSSASYTRDVAAFTTWLREGLAADVAKVRQLQGATL